MTPERLRKIEEIARRDSYGLRGSTEAGQAIQSLLADRAEILAVLNEVRSLIHSDAAMSGSRWYFSSARGERVHEVCGKVVDTCRKVEGQ